MLPKHVLLAILGALSVSEASVMHYDSPIANALARRQNRFASAATGQGDVVEDGQSPSATDDNNFINFCSGQTLTNGLQVQQGSCNGIVMGRIPGVDRMITSIIQNPQPGQTIQENETFDIVVNTQNLAAGSFTNPQETYYSAPQDLDGQGRIIGHTHVTVQDLGNNLTPQNPPSAQQFVFFKGINDQGNGQGILSATVTGGLPLAITAFAR
ncbi:unnamed protein product [Parascedosporium putredinis]|uniref:Uncharacterized protein n=1 Tax=Parascedosporium putredinis TaxID=1442378 RepID=A0A9P1MED8_9PEZI|nr:unnamed protein product [Parascedosporium putredinis]CAI8001345.1 unnamed protein product [Parascedosporium putredinis]